MNERTRLERILCDLNLPEGQWVINGSGVMVLHGIERPKPMGDLDIFCTTRLWFDLLAEGSWKVWTTGPEDPRRCCDPPYLYRDMYGLEVNIFHGWRRREVGNFDPAFYIYNAEKVAGWPCAPLQFLLDWKQEVGRAKDVDDIRILTGHLGGR
jgi:hypothetical protein